MSFCNYNIGVSDFTKSELRRKGSLLLITLRVSTGLKALQSRARGFEIIGKDYLQTPDTFKGTTPAEEGLDRTYRFLA